MEVRLLARIWLTLYVLVRLVEAGDIWRITQTETGNALLASVYSGTFLFGLSVVLVAVRALREWIAMMWHLTMELMLTGASIYHATLAANEPLNTVLASFAPDTRRTALLILFLFAQAVLALAGLHIVRWMASPDDPPEDDVDGKEQQTDAQAADDKADADQPPPPGLAA